MEKVLEFVKGFLDKRPSFSLLGFGVLLLAVATLVSFGFKFFIFMLAVGLIFLGWIFGNIKKGDEEYQRKGYR